MKTKELLDCIYLRKEEDNLEDPMWALVYVINKLEWTFAVDEEKEDVAGLFVGTEEFLKQIAKIDQQINDYKRLLSLLKVPELIIDNPGLCFAEVTDKDKEDARKLIEAWLKEQK